MPSLISCLENEGFADKADLSRTSPLLDANVLFLTEMVVVEVTRPHFRRMKNTSLYNVGLLSFLKGEESL